MAESNQPDETSFSPETPLAEPSAKVCGNCRLYKPVLQEAGCWKGDCRMMPDRGMFPATAPVCESWLPRAAPIPRALRQTHDVHSHGATRRPRLNVGPVLRSRADLPDVEIPELTDMTREELKSIIREAFEEMSEVRLAPKWEGGTMVLRPSNTTLQPRELPIDSIFHKVVMLRDRLRVLEQKINGHVKLSDAEKVEMQQYITKCYGSLTSFNLLFADKEDQFVGEKGKTE